MNVYKDKICSMCESPYTPTSPKQRFCIACKKTASKLAQSERDRRNNRLTHNIVYTNICPSCNKQFDTYDSKKKYCGDQLCDLTRRRKNSCLADLKRSHTKIVSRLLKRAKNKGKKLKYIKTYISLAGYKLVAARKYKNSHHSKLTLKCPIGHIYDTTFHTFKTNGSIPGSRCPICYQQNNYISRPEQLVRDFIYENFPDMSVEYNNRSILSPKELDLYFPEKKLAIEVCGLYWHGELNSGKPRDYHYNKMMQCYDKGIRLITIFEDELLKNKDIVFSRIRQALGKPSNRVYARKCVLREITSSEANTFFVENHIQGRSTASIAIGLYFEETLVCVGSLGKISRAHTSSLDTIELKRFCTLVNTSVVGGISRIFKHMLCYAKSNNIKYIKSYCDMRYANIFAPVYETIGFSLNTLSKYTPHYTKAGKRYRNMGLRKTVEERLTGLTEWELRKEQGYDRIWDCGHRTYTYVID